VKIGIIFRAAALRADKPPVLGHINENHVVPELQFLERPGDSSQHNAVSAAPAALAWPMVFVGSPRN
jgi:hypothetical protein